MTPHTGFFNDTDPRYNSKHGCAKGWQATLDRVTRHSRARQTRRLLRHAAGTPDYQRRYPTRSNVLVSRGGLG
jgi:hypothetical protein